MSAITKEFCEELHSQPEFDEVMDHAGENDVEVDGVRFIADSAIDKIQQDELASDEYIIGCFNASFLTEITGIDQEVFEAMQQSDAFEAIGKLIISGGYLAELQEKYSSFDGYGHHFNGYDGNEEEIEIDGILYHVFDNH